MCIAICYKEDMENALSKALSELLRRTKGATQTKVGKHAGISQPYVSDLKNGDRDGGIQLWERISDFFGMEYDQFYAFGKQLIYAEENLKIPSVAPPVGAVPTAAPHPKRRKTDIENQTDKNHEKLVGRFVDKETALEINRLLVKIEELEGSEGLKAALEWAEFRLHKASKKNQQPVANGTEGK